MVRYFSNVQYIYRVKTENLPTIEVTSAEVEKENYDNNNNDYLSLRQQR